MDHNNPAEMSNEDLERDMQQKNLERPEGNQELLNKSTAAEGTLKSPEEDTTAGIRRTASNYTPSEDLDDTIHEQSSDDSQDGSAPDPESLDNWENNEDNSNKISG